MRCLRSTALKIGLGTFDFLRTVLKLEAEYGFIKIFSEEHHNYGFISNKGFPSVFLSSELN